MVKFFDGQNRKVSVEAAMNHVNVYLNGRGPAHKGLGEDMLGKYYEEFAAYTERLNGEFDLLEVQPVTAGGKGLKGFARKIVGKCVGWYMKDILKRQTDFNMHLIGALNSEKVILEELIRRQGPASGAGERQE